MNALRCTLYRVFATEADRLVGVVGMRDLVLAKPSESLAGIMIKNPFAFGTDTSIQEAVGEVLYRHHSLYPVVDDSHQVVGVVHGWCPVWCR